MVCDLNYQVCFADVSHHMEQGLWPFQSMVLSQWLVQSDFQLNCQWQSEETAESGKEEIPDHLSKNLKMKLWPVQ